MLICEKYLYEGVLSKRIQYNYNDRQIWNQILPGILSEKGDDNDEGIQLD